jgi:hypothetical protein
VTQRWKKLSTKVTTLIQDSSRSKVGARSYDRSKFRESSQDHFRTPFRESQQNVPFGCSFGNQPQRILYGGRWWFPPSSGRGESCVSKCLWQVPTLKGVPNAKPNVLWLVFGCRFTRDKLVPLPSLIPRFPIRPSTPF